MTPAHIENLEKLLLDPVVTWPEMLTRLGLSARAAQAAILAHLPKHHEAWAKKKAATVISEKRPATMDRIKPRVAKAAETVNLEPSAPIVQNSMRLLCAVMAEFGSPDLPYGWTAAIQEVMTEHGCAPAPAGSLRWYCRALIDEPQRYGTLYALPAEMVVKLASASSV